MEKYIISKDVIFLENDMPFAKSSDKSTVEIKETDASSKVEPLGSDEDEVDETNDQLTDT